MPPFGRLAAIILSGPDEAAVFDYGRALARGAAPLERIGALVLGPAPAPIQRIRGQHRVRLLVKAARIAPLQDALVTWLDAHPPPRGARVAVDIDPHSFL